MRQKVSVNFSVEVVQVDVFEIINTSNVKISHLKALKSAILNNFRFHKIKTRLIFMSLNNNKTQSSHH